MIYAALIILVITIFIIVNKNIICIYKIRTWLIVVMGSYLGDFIFLMFQLHHLKQFRRENFYIIVFRFLIQCFLVSWLIYGNVYYYQNDLAGNTEICGSLSLIMFLVLLLGYFEMLRCCFVGTCVCLIVPFLLVRSRRN
jgi:hypothetical protein